MFCFQRPTYWLHNFICTCNIIRMIYRRGSALTNVNKQTIETNCVIFTLRVICLFANTGSEWALGLAEPVPGRSRGMLFPTATILGVIVEDAELEKLYLNLSGWKPFFFPWLVEVIINISVGMWKDCRHPERYKILTKTFYFYFVGSCRSPW